MFPTSVNRHIDEHLQNTVLEIENENPHLSVFYAHQFRWILSQYPVELIIKEPRKFNVLEEFIIRAGSEFETPPTPTELASILGLDVVFINNTIATLQSLQTLSGESKIKVTDEGRLFYQQGTVPQPPYTVNVYAVSNYLEGSVMFNSESLDDVSMKLPELSKFIKIPDKSIDIANWELAKIQQIIQDSGLSFHQPSVGKLVTGFQVLSTPKNIWQSVDLLVIFHHQEDKFSIQLRQGKNIENILKTASQKINSLLDKGKIALTELCELSDENK